MEGVCHDIPVLARRRDIVGKTTDRRGVTLNVVVGPLSKETHEEVALELAVKHLGQEVQVGDEGGLQDDRDVGSVEEFDGIGVGLSSLPLALQCKFDSEALLSKKN